MEQDGRHGPIPQMPFYHIEKIVDNPQDSKDSPRVGMEAAKIDGDKVSRNLSTTSYPHLCFIQSSFAFFFLILLEYS